MKRFHTKLLWVTAGLPLIPAILAFPALPEKIPVHWGMQGQVNGWAAKGMILPLSAVGLGITLLFLLCIKRVYPQKTQNHAAWETIALSCNLLVLGLTLMTITEAIRPDTLSIPRVLTLLLGVLYVVIGNVLPKLKQNRIAGVRTRWSYADAENWRYSNRIAGYLMCGCGLLLIVLSVLLPPNWLLISMIVLTLLCACVSTLASYHFAKKRRETDETE